MSKSYSHAGVSKLDGVFKVRFCNDALRTKVLQKNGHTDIDIIELKHPMSKLEVVAYLMEINFANGNKAVEAAIEQALDKRSPKAKEAKQTPAPKKAVAPKAKAKAAPKAKAPTKDAVPAATDKALEDAPY